MEAQGLIDPDDVTPVIRLLGETAGMLSDLADRRRFLMTGIAKMIEADIWMWAVSRGMADNAPAAMSLIDGGYASDEERSRIVHATVQPETNTYMQAQVPLHFHNTNCIDFDAFEPGPREYMAKLWKHMGLSESMFTFYPLGEGAMSCLGFHRRIGGQPFTDRDRNLVHLITTQIDWLHRAGTNVSANSPALAKLTPRQSETLIYVLAGDSRKEIARKMGLSEHTVTDHLKSLHRHFGVSSRGELLAKFVGSANS